MVSSPYNTKRNFCSYSVTALLIAHLVPSEEVHGLLILFAVYGNLLCAFVCVEAVIRKNIYLLCIYDVKSCVNATVVAVRYTFSPIHSWILIKF